MNKEWLKCGFILYGCGLEAEKYICRNMEMLSYIEDCVDGYRNGYFHGNLIKKIEQIKDISNRKILVASLPETYQRIKAVLDTLGLSEFKHYAHISYFEKKIIAINANCHGVGLVRYLNMSKEFRKKYVIYPIPEIQSNSNKEISPLLLGNLDVLITQDVRIGNKFSDKLSLEYLKFHVNASCEIIVIPNMVGMGTWLYPQHGNNDIIVKTANGEWPLMHENLVIESAIKAGCKELSEFVEYLNDYEFDEKIIKDNFNKFIKKIEARELNWDIKIKDYIMKHIGAGVVFCDKDHPSVEMMKYIGKKVIKKLKLKNIDDNEYDFILGLPMPLLRCVRNCFNIVGTENDCLNYYRCKDEDLLETYIRNYLFIYHEIII